MFGYVVANPATLSVEQLDAYRSYYCGLCRCLGSCYGSSCRLILNYDMTFLILLHSSLYDLQQNHNSRRCLIHPIHKHNEIINDATYYAATMNLLLSYHKCLDDWRDEKSFLRLLLSKILDKDIPLVNAAYPNKSAVIQSCLAELTDMEAQNIQDPDRACALFGALMGEVFAWRQDRWSKELRNIGDMLGRYVYLSDAVLDLPQDIKRGRYNPLSTRWTDEFDKQAYVPVLKMYLGECIASFEQLPIVENTALLHNILYSGIWTRFYQDKHISDKEEHHVR